MWTDKDVTILIMIRGFHILSETFVTETSLNLKVCYAVINIRINHIITDIWEGDFNL
jgi:hypothetical protein